VICSKLAKMQKDLTVSYLSSYKQDFVNKSNERTVEKIFRRGGGQNSQNSNSAELFGKPIIRVLENVYLHVDSCVFVFTRRVMPKYGRYPEDTVLRRRNRRRRPLVYVARRRFTFTSTHHSTTPPSNRILNRIPSISQYGISQARLPLAIIFPCLHGFF